MTVMTDPDRAVAVTEVLARRVQDGGVFPSKDEVVARIATEHNLVFYVGIDPTGPSIHIGHTIPLLLMGDLQRLGHRAILLVGDFTARIGDPTDKQATRTALDEVQVQENMASYIEQVRRVLPDTELEVRYNSEWLATMTMEQVVRLAGKTTVQQMLAREMFQERLKREKPIAVSEFLYPLLQGYDSVALRVDGEIGGNDQTFNMLVGRDLERDMLGKDKMVLATRLLVDAATGKKVSKTEGGFIAVSDSPQEIRRKVLASIPDEMTRTVFELCTRKPMPWIAEHEGDDPVVFKEALAEELVQMYHGANAVAQAHEPVEVEVAGLPLDKGLVVSGAVSSVTSAHNLIDQHAVRVGEVVATEWKQELKKEDEIRVGKGKFYKVK